MSGGGGGSVLLHIGLLFINTPIITDLPHLYVLQI